MKEYEIEYSKTKNNVIYIYKGEIYGRIWKQKAPPNWMTKSEKEEKPYNLSLSK